jgi:glycosyltransferase involved in cell wall biosynthesis
MAYAGVARGIIETRGTSIISAYNLHATGPTGALLSETYGIPLVVSNFGELLSMTPFFRTHLPVVRYVTRVGKVLLSCSRHCAKSYGILGLAPAVRVIPYGVDVDRFSPRPDGSPFRRRLGLPEADPVVIFVGRMIRDMGLHTILEAAPLVWQRQRNVRFLIVGASGELLPRAREMASRFPIVVAADVPFADLPSYYAAATVALVPTLGDRACSSLAAMEAMASGVPVIGAAIGGIPEVIEDGVSGILVPPGDPPALANDILHLLQDDPLRGRLARVGRQVVERDFDQRRTNAAVEAVFQELLGLPDEASPHPTS